VKSCLAIGAISMPSAASFSFLQILGEHLPILADTAEPIVFGIGNGCVEIWLTNNGHRFHIQISEEGANVLH
jgi:hypothetical protein